MAESLYFDVSADGVREVVDASRAEALMAPLLTAGQGSDDKPVRGFCLTNKSYTREGAKVVAAALARAAAAGRFDGCLETVDIADIIAGRPEEEALEVLRTVCAPLAPFKSLTAIDVSDNAFGAKGLDACADLLVGQAKLTSLKAQNNGISMASARQLCATVLEAGCGLERFHFHNNMSGPEGAAAIGAMLASPNLRGVRDLRFSGTRAQREGTLKVAEALRHATRLTALDLCDNTFQGPGSLALAAALRGMDGGLRVLRLRDGSLGAAGVAHVCQALAECRPPLAELDLSGNEVGEDDDDEDDEDEDDEEEGGGGGGGGGGGSGKAPGLKEAVAALRLALATLAPTLQVFLCEDNELKSKVSIFI